MGREREVKFRIGEKTRKTLKMFLKKKGIFISGIIFIQNP